MKMFVFPNGKDFTPQPWVGRDVATYFTVYVDIHNAFDNFGPLYDEIIGEEGHLAADPRGHEQTIPAVRRSILARSSSPTSASGSPWSPTTICRSPRAASGCLWAIETKDEAAVAKAIEKCVKNDPTIKKREIAGHVVWEIVEEEDTGVPQLKVDVPSLTPKKDDGKTKPDENDDDQDKEGHFLPHGAITVAHGQLFVASHIDFLAKILKPLGANDRLATQPEFQQVWDLTFGKLGVKQQSSRSFSWTDRAVQPTYELIRQGKMPQSESLLGRTLNSLAALRPGQEGGAAAATDRRQQAARLRRRPQGVGPVNRRHDQRGERLVHQGRADDEVTTSLPLSPRRGAACRRGRGGPRASSRRWA